MNPSNKSAERHLIVKVQSRPKHCERVKELLLQLVDPVRSEPGCLYYNIFRQAEDQNAFMIAAGWADDEALAAHLPHHNVVDQLIQLLSVLWKASIPCD